MSAIDDYMDAHSLSWNNPSFDSRGQKPYVNYDDQDMLSYFHDNLMAGAGAFMNTGAHIVENWMTPEALESSYDIPWLEKKGKELQEEYSHNYTPGTAGYYGAMMLQSAPEMLFDTATGAAAAAAASSILGPIGSAAAGSAAALARAAKWGKRAVDFYTKSKNPIARGMRYFTPAPQTVLATVAQTPIEAKFEGQRATDDYIDEAKRKGTYVPGQTEYEAKQLGDRVFRDNMIALTGTNVVENAMTFGRGKKGFLRGLGRFGAASGMEGLEEGIQQIIPKAENGEDWSVTDQDVIDSAITGAIMGGGMHLVGRGARAAFPNAFGDSEGENRTFANAILDAQDRMYGETGGAGTDYLNASSGTTSGPMALIAEANASTNAKLAAENAAAQKAAEPTAQPVAAVVPEETQAQDSASADFGAGTYDMPTQGDAITEQVQNLKAGWADVLPQIGGVLHNQFGLDGVISSAARTPEHNAEVGGAEHSHHIDNGDGGDAVDIVLPDGTTAEQAEQVKQYFENSGAFQEVLFHDAGSGYHLHLGGLKGSLGDAGTSAGGSVDVSNLPYGNIAMAISQRTGIPAQFVWAQMAWETGDFSSGLSVEDHNYGGIKRNDGSGEYRHFDSDEDYIDYASKNLNAYKENGIGNARTIDEFAAALKDGGYFTDDLGHYTEGLKSKLAANGLPESGFGGSGRSSSSTNFLNEKPSFDINSDDAEGRKMIADFIDYWGNRANVDDADTIQGMLDANGKFRNTQENRDTVREKWGDELQQYADEHMKDEQEQDRQETQAQKQAQQQADAARRAAQGGKKAASADNTKAAIDTSTPNLDAAKQQQVSTTPQATSIDTAGESEQTQAEPAQSLPNTAHLQPNTEHPASETAHPATAAQANAPAQAKAQQAQPTTQASQPTAQAAPIEQGKAPTVPKNETQNAEQSTQTPAQPQGPTLDAQQATKQQNALPQPAQTPQQANPQMSPAEQRARAAKEQRLQKELETNATLDQIERGQQLEAAAKQASVALPKGMAGALHRGQPQAIAQATLLLKEKGVALPTVEASGNTVYGAAETTGRENSAQPPRKQLTTKASYTDKSQEHGRGSLNGDKIMAWDGSKGGIPKKDLNFSVTLDEIEKALASYGNGRAGLRKLVKQRYDAAVERWIESAKNPEVRAKRRRYWEDDTIHMKGGAAYDRAVDSYARVVEHLYEAATGQKAESPFERHMRERSKEKQQEKAAPSNAGRDNSAQNATAPRKVEPAENASGQQMEKPSSKKSTPSRKPVKGKAGKSVTVTTDSGKELHARYRIVPASSLTTSNVYDGDTIAKNDAYPQELQPRERSGRKEMQAQTDGMAADLHPADLEASRNLNQGAPLIRSDGVVLNGNGRTMAITRAYALRNKAGKRYAQYLVEHAEDFGFTKDQMRAAVTAKGMDKPVLVRELTDDVDADTTQEIINSKIGGASMSATEQAEADAKRIKSSDFNDYDQESDGDLTKGSNDGFVSKLLRKLIGKDEANKYTDKNGQVNQDGYRRVKRAIFSRAYGDTDLIAKMAESMDDAIKNISNGLQSAAANVARLNLKMQEGDAYRYPLAKTIARAVKKYNAIKEGKAEANVEAYANENETSLTGGDPEEVVKMVQALDDFHRSGKKVGTFLNHLADILDHQGSPKEDATAFDFGEASKPLTLSEAIDQAKEKTVTGGEQNLFGASAERTEPAPKAKAAEEAAPAKEDNSIFGSVEDADKELFTEFGINPDEEQQLSAPDGITNTAEERARLEKELTAELNKLGANPVFNPKIYELGVRIAFTYVKDGINTAKKLVATLEAKFGDKIGPWAPAIVETVRTWPKGVAFDAGKVRALSKAVGARYERGITTRDAMHADMKKSLGGHYDSFAPMIDAAYNGIEKFFHPEKEATNHADDSTRKLAERAGTRGHQDAVGRDDAGREPSRGSEHERVPASGAERRPFGSIRVRDGGTASRGTAGNRGVQAGESVDRANRAGNPELSGGVKSGLDGSAGLDREGQAERTPSAQERQLHAAAEKVKAANEKPKTGKVKTADLDDIKRDCPSLQDAQAEDVQFGEARLFDKGGTGVLFTNGTGTGKTFTGLGLVKRMIERGKKNILIVSPTAEINKAWVDTAKKYFGVDIHVLKNTTDAGKEGEVCVTTYANFQQNNALVAKRDWDAVVADESHNIMNNAGGESTGILKMLRAVTMHARGLRDRLEFKYRTKKMQELMAEMADIDKQLKQLKRDRKKLGAESTATNEKLLSEKHLDVEAAYYTELGKLRASHKDVLEKWEKTPKGEKPKVIFLSATPFAYDKDVDYAEGYLFDYPADGQGYNSGSGRDKFMMQHFGYRMRYNKLTRPDGEVDNRAMEVQFHDQLASEGVLRGRQLDVDKDYDRGFLRVAQGVGAKIDEGFRILRDDKRFQELGGYLRKNFDRRAQRYLLESIKAKSAVQLAKQYEKMGRKVVIFHQAMVEHENIHPFSIHQKKGMGDAEMAQKIRAEYEIFAAEHPDLVHLNIGSEPSPMETFRKGFGGKELYIDGSSEHKKNRETAIKEFNDDTSGKNIIIIQQDAGNAGISLHDMTGKHPRVLINIALPERPSYAMQIEGRIYRVGNASNAVFRYLATGTDLEKTLFASTIGGRAETVENLAQGAKARGLRDAFTTLYQEVLTGEWTRRKPGHPEEGTGGKELDKSIGGDLSDYERAKTFYYARGKRTAKNKAAEGIDYFATPEPIGLKMVEWLHQKIGDRFLEPSAGHGAISRWSSPNAKNTIVEQSSRLAPEAQLVTPDAKVVTGDFMDFDVHNKFEGIAMNPPFGHGGKTAVEHIAKAYQHLADGGRLVAILPDGPSCMKHFTKWLYGEDMNGNPIKGAEAPKDAVLMADIRMPGVMFERAGTKVMTRIVVIDKYTNASDRDAASAEARGEADLRDITDINELFDHLENYTMPKRIGEDRVQNFTMEQNKRSKNHPYEVDSENEKVKGSFDLARMARKHNGFYYVDKGRFVFDSAASARAFMKDADRYIDENKELFRDEPEVAQEAESSAETQAQEATEDRAETQTAPTEEEAAPAEASTDDLFDTSDFRHTKTGEMIPSAKINDRVSTDVFKKARAYAKTINGYYSPYAKRFLFHREQDRDAFTREVGKLIREQEGGTKYSVSEGEARLAKAQTMDDLNKATQKVFPGSSEAEHTTRKNADGTTQDIFKFRLANGTDIEIHTGENINLPEREKARARREHGIDEGKDITVNGMEQSSETTITVNGRTVTKSSLARIVLSKFSDFTSTLYHEAFHVAYDLFLTNKEKAAIEHAYGEKAKAAGMTLEEYAADRYRDWARAKLKGLHVAYGKIWQKVSDGAEKTVEYMEETEETARIFREIESGKIWERPLDRATRERHNEVRERFWDEISKELASLKSPTDADLDRIFLQSRSIRRTLTDFFFKVRTNKDDAFEASSLFDLLGDEFEHDERISSTRQQNSTASLGGVRGRDGGAVSRNAAHGSRQESEGSNSAGVQPSAEVPSVLGLNDVKAIHDYYNDHKAAYRDRQQNNEGRPNEGGLLRGGNEQETRSSIHYSAEEAKEQAHGFLHALNKKFQKATHLDVDRVEREVEKQNPDHDISVTENWVHSPHVVASRHKAFKVIYTMGCRAMDMLTIQRDRFNKKFDDALSLVNKKEKQDLYDLLLRGDAEGKEWTKQELLDDGMSENVADAYIRIRRLMTKAYHMVNNARRHPTPKTQTMTKGELDELKKSPFLMEIQSVTDLGRNKDGATQYRVSYKEARHYEKTYLGIPENALETYQNDPGMQVLEAKETGDTDADGRKLYDVKVLEGPADMTKLTGYIPHFFHDYFLRIVDKDGHAVRTIGSGRTQRDAVLRAEEWMKTNELKDGETIHVQPKVFDFGSVGMDEGQYAPIMGDRDYFGMVQSLAKDNDMTVAEAKEMLEGKVRLKGRHRFFGNAMHRTGVEGYETDLDWVLRHYFNSAVRYAAMETEFKPKAISFFERVFGRFDDDYENNPLAKYAKDYINDVNGNPSAKEQVLNKALRSNRIYRNFIAPTFGDRAALTLGNGITNKVSYLTLAFNMSSALLNLQQLTNAAAYIGNVGSLVKMVKKGMPRRKKGKDTPRYTRQELRILQETGVLGDIGLDSGSGYDKMRSRASSHGRNVFTKALATANNTMDWIGAKGMIPFNEMDAACRRGAVLAAYEKARREGKSHADAITYAREINVKSNFIYGVQDAPNIIRRGSIFSQLAFQFKKFGIKELEVMQDFMPNVIGLRHFGSYDNIVLHKYSAKQKIMFWGMYAMLCGAIGIPALDWLDDLFGNDKRGYPKDAIQKFIIEKCGGNKRLAAAFMYGVPALFNINLSSRASLADVIPTKAIDFAGPFASKAYQLKRDAWDDGNFANSLRDISPGAYNLYAACVGEARGKRDRLNTRYDTMMDKFLRAVGFRSVDESVPVDVQRIISHDKAASTQERQEAQDAYIQNPTSENKQRLKDLGIKEKDVQKEATKKNQTREERTQGTVSKKDKDKYKSLTDFMKE